MFHIEVTGPAQKTGTFILPSTKRTYFVHCDIAQHMEKGMKAQLKVAGGDGDLPSIPGIVGDPYPDRYEVEDWGWQAALRSASPVSWVPALRSGSVGRPVSRVAPRRLDGSGMIGSGLRRAPSDHSGWVAAKKWGAVASPPCAMNP